MKAKLLYLMAQDHHPVGLEDRLQGAENCVKAVTHLTKCN